MEHANPMVNIQLLSALGVRETARRLLTQVLMNEVFKVHYAKNGMVVIEVVAGICFTKNSVTVIEDELLACGYVLHVENDFFGNPDMVRLIVVDHLDVDGQDAHFPDQVRCIVRINHERHACSVMNYVVAKQQKLVIELVSIKGNYRRDILDYKEFFSQANGVCSNCVLYDADRGVDIRSFDKTAYAFTFATKPSAKVFYERITKLRNAK